MKINYNKHENVLRHLPVYSAEMDVKNAHIINNSLKYRKFKINSDLKYLFK